MVARRLRKSKRLPILQTLERRNLLAVNIGAQQLQQSADAVWAATAEIQTVSTAGTASDSPADSMLRADDYRLFILDDDRLAGELAWTGTEHSSLVSIPNPDGTFQSFKIESSTAVSGDLADLFPEIQAYVGVGVDDPNAKLRMEVSPAGFHAQVVVGDQAYYVDPYYFLDNRLYASYAVDANIDQTLTTKRVRINVNAGDEFTSFHGGTALQGQAAIVTAVNRVAGLYEHQFASQLQIVAGDQQHDLRLGISAIGDHLPINDGTFAVRMATALVMELNSETNNVATTFSSPIYQLGPDDDPNTVLLPPDALYPPDSDLSGQSENRFSEFQFVDSDRWSSTVTNGGGLSQGDPTTLTWSFVPDGTSVFGFNGEPTAPSDLIAFLGTIHGVTTNDTNYEDEAWFPLFDSYLSRWGELSGLSYIYESNDDGAALTETSIPGGVSGVRGDMRITGHFIDGQTGSNTLAYNFFPNVGDMVIDTSNTGFFGNANNNFRGLRNVLSHEHGHGIGIEHVCPIIGGVDGRLMEPFINTRFDGPQFDDILAVHRGYGDVLEKNGGNDSFGTATDLGDLNVGATILRGTDALDNRVAAGDTDFVSIDDDGDVDYFSFNVASDASAAITLTPRGPTYLSGPQNPNGSCSAGTQFIASQQSDLTLELIDSDGTTVIVTSNANGLGGVESLISDPLAAGTYFARISGADNAAQMYELQLDGVLRDVVNVTESGVSTDVSESGDVDTYTLALNTSPSGDVDITVDSDSQTEVSSDGTNFSNSLVLTFSSTAPQTVTVRAIDDSQIEGTHSAVIKHAITTTADPTKYPTSLLIDNIDVNVTDNELAPFVRQRPLGGLVAISEGNAGSIDNGADQEDLSFYAQAGQTIAIAATPDSAVRLSVELIGVTGVITATSAGDQVVLPTTSITTSGNYTVRVTSDGATGFDLQAFLNTVVEQQVGDSADGNELATDDSLITLGSGRVAATGLSAPIIGTSPAFTQTNDPSLFVDISTTGTSLGLSDDGSQSIATTVDNAIFPAGNVTVSNNGGIFFGSGSVPFTNATLPTTSFGNALIPYWDDLGDTSGDVYWQERQVNGINALIVQWNDRGHFSGANGATFQIQLFDSGPLLARYAYADVDFGSSGLSFGASATIGYQESSSMASQFSFNTASLANGDVLDFGFSVTPDVDEYTVDLTGKSGQPVDIVLAGRDGAGFTGEVLELLDTDGTSVLATGTVTNTNFDLGILGFVVPADGVYTVRLSSTVDDAGYGIVLSDSLSLDSEANDVTSDPLRDLANTRAAFGHLQATDQVDVYALTVGDTRRIEVTTGTPFDDSNGSPLNDLDPEVTLIDTDGSTVLTSDLDSLDGKNARAILDPSGTGTFFIMVTSTAGTGEYTLHVEDLPPSVVSVDINSTAVQRSVLTRVEVLFDTEVNAPAAAFQITQRGSNTPVGNLQVNNTLVGGQTKSLITFAADPLVEMRSGIGNNSLVDGNYELKVLASAVTDVAGGTNMKQDFRFGTDAIDLFFRFFGDTTGDRDVDANDLTEFSTTFRLDENDPSYEASLDAENDGDVDAEDLTAFAGNFRLELNF